MMFQHRTRQQKLIDAVYFHFGALAAEHSDQHVLSLCTRLLRCQHRVLDTLPAQQFVFHWDLQHPEEFELKPQEFLWAISNLQSYMRKTLDQGPVSKAEEHGLRVINGGLSAHPDRPVPNT